MMSTSMIISESRRAARESARRGEVPLLFEAEDLNAPQDTRTHSRGIPFIGDRKPRGWQLQQASDIPAFAKHSSCLMPWHDDAKFPRSSLVQVDSSGWGSPGEPALTQDEWIEAVRAAGPGYAYAIVETGQFQCVVGIFKPTR